MKTPSDAGNSATVAEAPLQARATFTSSLGVLAATLGSAVGLGNIWKFPALTGLNGGAAFVMLYLLCVILIGMPVMWAELTIGRNSRANTVAAFQKLAPKTPWYLIGVSGVVSAVLIMGFYTVVCGWIYAYIFRAATGALAVPPEQTVEVFNALYTSPIQPIVWQWIVLAVTSAIVMAGVTKGIEAATKRLMPLLFLLLLICDIRALTLPGASEGLSFLLKPDLSKITAPTVLAAMGLAFFKLSLGMGCMVTYGSYINKNENLIKNTGKVVAADTTVSLLAGLAIFPAVFAFGYEPTSGPSLLFITIPAVFRSMPLGGLFCFLFFVLAAVAATGAMISLIEVPVAYLTERFGWKRNLATLATALSMALLGVGAALSSSLLSEFKIIGRTLFDTYDFVTSNVLLPVGGIFIALFVGWKWRQAAIAENGGATAAINAFTVFLRFVAPIAITLVLLQGLGIIRF
ncbi:MAG TPA: sodium-dependent transporter [Firmicutes bacterium]|nr:sodium-dependent transporter [Bacillota bacterium]